MIFLSPLILLLGVGAGRLVFAPYAGLYGDTLEPIPTVVFLRLAVYDLVATSAFDGLAGWVMMASWPRTAKVAWKILWWAILVASLVALCVLGVFVRSLGLGLGGYNSLDGRMVSALGGGNPFENWYSAVYGILPLLAYLIGAALCGLRRSIGRRGG